MNVLATAVIKFLNKFFHTIIYVFMIIFNFALHVYMEKVISYLSILLCILILSLLN